METDLLQQLHDGLSQSNNRRGRQGGLGGVAGQKDTQNSHCFFNEDGDLHKPKYNPVTTLFPSALLDFGLLHLVNLLFMPRLLSLVLRSVRVLPFLLVVNFPDG
ncbi:hypothetical protein cyc_01390 [Cyclospora cayetanensis]|uniref:Uncharacterized protein n=1 Tax=Cyclospora cayetanensis TaxID=88456 RepID=A0A1D3CXX8_9EIME|nr:hypothetical protein cyc_01390 [Cyclospora cayetanensis]